MSETRPLLEVKDLCVTFGGWRGAPEVEAVKHASFTLDRVQTLALVGESGSGKSVTALSILQLLPYPAARHTPESSIRFAGEELVGGAPARLCASSVSTSAPRYGMWIVCSVAPMYPADWRPINMMTIAYGHGIAVSALHLV